MTNHAFPTVRGYYSILTRSFLCDISVDDTPSAVDSNRAMLGLVVIKSVIVRKVSHGALGTVMPWSALFPGRSQLLYVTAISWAALSRLRLAI